MSAHIAMPNFVVDWNAALDKMTSSIEGATVTGSRSQVPKDSGHRYPGPFLCC
jgi:hypothetical protein